MILSAGKRQAVFSLQRLICLAGVAWFFNGFNGLLKLWRRIFSEKFGKALAQKGDFVRRDFVRRKIAASDIIGFAHKKTARKIPAVKKGELAVFSFVGYPRPAIYCQCAAI